MSTPMTHQQIVTAFFIALLVFIISQVLWILSPFARPIFWAAILAFAFYPVHLKVKSALKGHENTPAVITSAIVFVTFVPLAVFVVAGLVGEVLRFSEIATDFVRQGRLTELLMRLESYPVVQKIQHVLFRSDYVQENARHWLENAGASAADFAAKQALHLTKSVFYAPFEFFLILFLIFFFLKDGPKIYEFFYEATPLETPDKKTIFKQINNTFEAVIRGQLLTALAQSSIGGLVYWAVGLPLPIFFAAATFLTSLVPIFGAAAVWLPLTFYLVIKQAYLRAAILFILGVSVISSVDNLLKPILIGKKTKLPYLLLFLGILGGIEVYGLVGMFLAPAVLSLFFSLIAIYREKFL